MGLLNMNKTELNQLPKIQNKTMKIIHRLTKY